MSELDRYRSETAAMEPHELLAWASDTFGPGGVAFASSMGAEDQVITHMIAAEAPAIPVFTLDTGRLYAQTYDLIDQTRKRYGITISVYFPAASRVEEMVAERGPNLFYESIENRKRCCHVRKVEPLGRALAGRRAWIVGLRRGQSITRQDIETVAWDEANGLVKIAPLANWTEEAVWSFITSNDVPYHPLHDEGFPSIGCAPCTRAVKPGEDARAGRWWWETPEHRECGIHTDGQPPATAPIVNVERLDSGQ